MKKLILVSAFFSLLSLESFAKLPDGFFFQPAVTIEYSAPSISSGVSKNFSSNNFGKQISGFENIALGANVRVHKNLGFNANWYQGALSGNSLQNAGYLNNKARYKFDQYNFSTLVYIPATNFAEFFVEGGIANIRSHLNYVSNSGSSVSQSANHNKGFYGAGIQFKICEKSGDAIRLSFQKYSGKLALIDTNYSTVRIGYLKVF